MNTTGITIKANVHFNTSSRGRKRMAVGEIPKPSLPVNPGRVPRIARLMALAIRFDDLIRRGEVRDYAELARLPELIKSVCADTALRAI